MLTLYNKILYIKYKSCRWIYIFYVNSNFEIKTFPILYFRLQNNRTLMMKYNYANWKNRTSKIKFKNKMR